MLKKVLNEKDFSWRYGKNVKNAICRFRTEVAFFDIPCIPNGSDVMGMPKGYVF